MIPDVLDDLGAEGLACGEERLLIPKGEAELVRRQHGVDADPKVGRILSLEGL